MIHPKMTASALALMIGLASAPLSAETDKTPKGEPCNPATGGSSNGPCKGNSGNAGQNGNKNDDGVTIIDNPGAIGVAMPSVMGRSAYVTQIGDGNSATVSQSAPRAFARVEQSSHRNSATVVQMGTGTAYADVRQRGGDGNIANVTQDGPGANVLYVVQDGAENVANAYQYGGGSGHNGARMTQLGSGNVMDLTQTGGDNVALLEQEGAGNSLNVTQDGGKQLTFLQKGNGLSFTIDQQHPRLLITQVNPN